MYQPLHNQPQPQLYPSLGAPPGYSNNSQKPNQPPQYGQAHLPQNEQRVFENTFGQDLRIKIALKAEKFLEKEDIEKSLLRGGYALYMLCLLAQIIFLGYLNSLLAKQTHDLLTIVVVIVGFSLMIVQAFIMILGISFKSLKAVKSALFIMYFVCIYLIGVLIYFICYYFALTGKKRDDTNLAEVAILICIGFCLLTQAINFSVNILVGKLVKKKMEKINDLAEEINVLEIQTRM